MNYEQAIREVSKHAPCPHHAMDTQLGDGGTWARCCDCGSTFLQASLLKLRAECERFDEAILILREGRKDG
jgi:hypothetical protein